MSSALVTDLQFAQQAGMAVRIQRYSGGDLGLIGVHEVSEAEGWVSFSTPRTMGDESSRTRVNLDDIASVEVTDIEF